MTMGLGVDLAEVDDRVRRSVAEGTADARRQLETILERAVSELSGSFDPEHRTSAARAIAEFGVVRDGLLNAIDPGHRDSVASKFLGELDELLGPGGKLEGVLERSRPVGGRVGLLQDRRHLRGQAHRVARSNGRATGRRGRGRAGYRGVRLRDGDRRASPGDGTRHWWVCRREHGADPR